MTKASNQPRIGIHGVQLKKFEEVVCDCIHEVIPNYFPLPNLPNKAKSALIASAVEQYRTEPIQVPEEEDDNGNVNSNSNSADRGNVGGNVAEPSGGSAPLGGIRPLRSPHARGMPLPGQRQVREARGGIVGRPLTL